MLSLFTRRVALSTYRPNAVYSRILPSSAPVLRSRRTSGAGLHTRNAQTSADARRNVSTKATATAKRAESSTKSGTEGRKKSVRRLTPEQKEAQRQRVHAKNQLARKKKAERAAALRAKQKARADKERELAALKRKRLAEKKKLAEAKKKKRHVIKPPGKRMSGFALLVKETKKPLREVAAMWHNLPDTAKEEYSTRAKAMVGKRKEEFDAFVKTVPRSDILRYNRVQKSKGKHCIRLKTPGRPLTGFMAYLKEFRARPEHVGMPVLEASKAAGEAWRSLTQEERAYYKPKPTESSTV